MGAEAGAAAKVAAAAEGKLAQELDLAIAGAQDTGRFIKSAGGKTEHFSSEVEADAVIKKLEDRRGRGRSARNAIIPQSKLLASRQGAVYSAVHQVLLFAARCHLSNRHHRSTWRSR